MSDEETRPQRKKPLIAGSGWLLFVCLFLPTLRVCGDPTAPIEFPPAYVAHLGGLALGAIAFTTTLRARRAWFSIWFTLWYLTAVGIIAAVIGSAARSAGLVTVGIGLISSFVVTPAFHRQSFTPRGFWIGGIAHGVVSIGWYMLLAADPEAMWGAYLGLGAAAMLVAAAGIALAQYSADRARERRANEPAPLPVARVVERD